MVGSSTHTPANSLQAAMSPTDFRRYAEALNSAGVASPVLVVDLDVLDDNSAAVHAEVHPGQQLRLVAKSLPVPQLIRRVLTVWDSNRLMTFSVAMLRQIDTALPGLSHLMGKPMPVGALRTLCGDETGVDLATRVVWLLDTTERIKQYAALADELQITLPVAVEVDVGLHRGGFSPTDLTAGLRTIADRSSLHFAGVMGYEPHLPALPRTLGLRRAAEKEFEYTYAQAIASAAAVFGETVMSDAIRNSAGSKTLAERATSTMFNDLSVGSLLVKPTDFADVAEPATRPALFIATPVLKVVDHLQIPGFGGSRLAQLGLLRGSRYGVYIHGGHWLADPVDPPGFGYSGVIGRSSNQELLVTRERPHIRVDDLFFLQPHQSEAVMLQFGPIAVIRGDRVVDWWEPFTPTA